jgi:hypothetical protein
MLLLELRRQLAAIAAVLRSWATLLSGRAAALASEAGYDPDSDDVHTLATAVAPPPQPADSGLVAADLPEQAVPGERVLRACRDTAAAAETTWDEPVDPYDRAARMDGAERCTQVAQDAQRRARQAKRYVELLGDLVAEEIARTPSDGPSRAGTAAATDELERLSDTLVERSKEQP